MLNTQLPFQEAYFQSIFDHIELVIFVWNITEDGQILHGGWNAACEAATGIRSADIVGKPPEALFTPERVFEKV
jgi:PAS domain-containing protein